MRQLSLHSDSKYLVDAVIKGWAEKWQAQGWKRGKDGKAANPDLWARLLELAATHRVTFKWVPAHRGIPENERCDKLANTAARGDDLLIDEGYEKSAASAATES